MTTDILQSIALVLLGISTIIGSLITAGLRQRIERLERRR